MRRTTLCVAFVAVALGCWANPSRPAMSPISERWKSVPSALKAPLVLSLAGSDQVMTASVDYVSGRSMDIYYPGGFKFERALPVVVFVMGYSSDYTMNWFGAKLKDLGQYVSWGQAVAASGMIAVAYETDYPDDDIEALITYIVKNGGELGMDSQRIALFGCSGNSRTALGALADKYATYRDSLRCGVIFYPIISYFMNKGADDEVMAAPFTRELPRDIPIYLVAIGDERPEWKAAADSFLRGVENKGYPLEVAYYEQGIHGFDTDQDTIESRSLIEHTLSFMKENLSR